MDIGNRIVVQHQYAKYEFKLFPSHLDDNFIVYRSERQNYYVKEIRKYYFMVFSINTDKECYYFGICPEDSIITDQNFYILNLSHRDPSSDESMEYQFLTFVTIQVESSKDYLNYSL